jgi:hypothetical protein
VIFFHVVIVFKFMAAEILLQLWIQVIIVLCQSKAAYALFQDASVMKSCAV